MPPIQFSGSPSVILHINAFHALDCPSHISTSDRQYQVQLRVLRSSVILKKPRTEPSSYRRRGDHASLLVVFGIELADCPCSSTKTCIQTVEKASQPALRRIGRVVGIAKPLNGRNREGSVEGAGSKRQPLAHI